MADNFLSNKEKAIAQLKSCGIDAFETNDTVYVQIKDHQLELAAFEINFQAGCFDEQNEEEEEEELP